jgi:hypothetical protein
MRFGLRLITLALLLLVAVAACSTGSSDDVESVEISGPALVMFYTDN